MPSNRLPGVLGIAAPALMALPPDARYMVITGLARALGGQAGHLLNGMRETLREEWRSEPLPSNDPDLVIAETFRSLALDSLEASVMSRVGAHDIGEWIRVHGLYHLEEAALAGNGVVLLTASFGEWRWLARALVQRGYLVGAVCPTPEQASSSLASDASRVRRLEELAQGEHESGGGLTWLRPPDYKEEGRELLGRGGVLVIPVDLPWANTWTSASLLRRSARIPATPFELALDVGAPMLPALVTRGPRRNAGRIQPGLRFHHTGDLEVDILSAASRLFRWLDEQIRRRPDHYLGWLRYRRALARAGLPDYLE